MVDGFFDWSIVTEFFYVIVGLLLIMTGIQILKEKEHPTRVGSALFWMILGFIFASGKMLSQWVDTASGRNLGHFVIGIMVIILALLSAFKQVNPGSIKALPEAFKQQQADKLGNKIFLPSVLLGLSAFAFAQFLPMLVKLLPASMHKMSVSVAGQLAIGLSAVIGLVSAMVLTKVKTKEVIHDTSNMIRLIGSASILPQLLAALGAIFTTAGIGLLIAEIFKTVIPSGNLLAGVMAYCVGMALFTMIMGNAFAAFSVITVGIGVPFLIANGANPAIVGALGLTAGYCGTLMTPMAANFNIVPSNLLETKNQYTIIKYQAPFAIILLGVHIVLMYVLLLLF